MSSTYLSTRGGGEITAAQFVMENFLLLLASQEKTSLPEKFWKLDKYKQLWKRHIRSVHARLKEYDAVVISKALRDKKLRNLRSLSNAAKFLWKPVFDRYQKEHNLQLKKENISCVDIDPSKRRESNNISGLQRLRDLDA